VDSFVMVNVKQVRPHQRVFPLPGLGAILTDLVLDRSPIWVHT
jgi:hypothetical protein